ncbi:MAG: glycosyltransferase family 87 protein [Pseudomonadota bacterium]
MSGFAAAETGAFTRRRVTIVLGTLTLLNLIGSGVLLWAIHRPGGLGTMMDFGAFWGAAVLALEGRGIEAYDIATLTAVQSEALGVPYGREMAWRYPPFLQVALMPLGALPLLPAQAVWTLFTAALYAAALLALAGRALGPGLTLAAGFAPATVTMLAVNGQTGFLTAALTALALVPLVHGRQGPVGQIATGVALGCLALKPPIGLALPVVLLVARRWVALASAALTVLGLVLVATLAFGTDVWAAFAEGLVGAASDSRASEVLDIQASVRATLLTVGSGDAVALGVQAVVSLVGLGLLVAATLGRLAPGFGAGGAALAALVSYATIAISPRVMDYDLLILVVGALAQLVRLTHRPAANWEHPVLGLAVLIPVADLASGMPLNWLLAPCLCASLVIAERQAQSGSASGASSANLSPGPGLPGGVSPPN